MRGLQESGGLFKYLQEVQAYISPPITAVFMLGLFFPKLNARGAMAALWTGFTLGVGKLAAIFLTDGHLDGTAFINSGPLVGYAEYNFLHFAFVLFLISSAVLIAFSLGHPSKTEEQLDGLVYKRSSISFTNVDILITAGLLLGVALLWILFSPLGVG